MFDEFTPNLIDGSSTHCFACDRSFTYRRYPADKRNGRFCSLVCQNTYDSGFVCSEVRAARYIYRDGRSMKMKGDGFELKCPGCDKLFVSNGLRYCSTECEREHRRKQEVDNIIADSGVKVDTKRRACEYCGDMMPRFVGGRRTSAKTRFCSRLCRRRSHREAQSHLGRGSCRYDAQKRPSNGPLKEVIEKASVDTVVAA